MDGCEEVRILPVVTNGKATEMFEPKAVPFRMDVDST